MVSKIIKLIISIVGLGFLITIILFLIFTLFIGKGKETIYGILWYILT